MMPQKRTKHMAGVCGIALAGVWSALGTNPPPVPDMQTADLSKIFVPAAEALPNPVDHGIATKIASDQAPKQARVEALSDIDDVRMLMRSTVPSDQYLAYSYIDETLTGQQSEKAKKDTVALYGFSTTQAFYDDYDTMLSHATGRGLQDAALIMDRLNLRNRGLVEDTDRNALIRMLTLSKAIYRDEKAVRELEANL